MTRSNGVNTMTGRSAFLALLKSEGITHLFGNPGTTELPIMHALKEHPDLTYVMAMQESLVVAMADGFSRASGKLVAANVHVAPGLGNAMGSLYNARFTGTPMILTAGQQEQGHGLMEPVLFGPMVEMATPLVKWAIEVTRLEDLPRIVRRAAKIAMTPPTGPVFISLPGDILNAEAGIDLLASTRIETSVAPDIQVRDKIIAKILSAKRPVIVVGDEVVKSDAWSQVERLADLVGAAVFQQSIAYGAHFRSRHPLFMGALTRQQTTTRKQLEPYDVLIALGTDPVRMSVYSPVSPMPEHIDILQIGLQDWDIGKNWPVSLAVKADVGATLDTLHGALAEAGGSELASAADKRRQAIIANNWSSRREKLAAEIIATADQMPINPDWLTLSIADTMPANGILIDEALTSGRYITSLYEYRDRYGLHGLASGGIGWGLPAAVGASLANPDRRVVAYVGDGSAMYSIQSLWTAANQKLPVTFVIPNNGGYRIIKQRLKAFHGNDHFIGMDFKDPSVNYSDMARSMGVPSTRVTEPGKLRDALKAAMNGSGPHLVEVMVDGSV